MPAQLPQEATEFFGDLLLPHVPKILKSDANQGRLVSIQTILNHNITYRAVLKGSYQGV